MPPRQHAVLCLVHTVQSPEATWPDPKNKKLISHRACDVLPGWVPCQPSCRWTDLHAKDLGFSE